MYFPRASHGESGFAALGDRNTARAPEWPQNLANSRFGPNYAYPHGSSPPWWTGHFVRLARRRSVKFKSARLGLHLFARASHGEAGFAALGDRNTARALEWFQNLANPRFGPNYAY